MRAVLVIAVLATVVLATTATFATSPLYSSKQSNRQVQDVTLGMGYVPSVQFAPFYVADQLGYYRQAGLKVSFSYGSSPNLLQLVGADRVDFAIADGTDAIAATANGIPIRYVMTMYQRLPVAIFSLRSSNIHTVQSLRGQTIGVPGRFGSTYVGLLAALHTAGLQPSDVTIRTIGFTQAESVVKGTVRAAVGYSNNEPVLLRRHGYHVTTLEVGSVTGLVGPGVVVGNGLIARDPRLVRRFTQATLRGLAYAIAHPATAFAAARRVHGLSSLGGRDVGDQYAVLRQSIDFWHSMSTRMHGLGYADPRQWRQSIRLLRAVGQVQHHLIVPNVVTNRFAAGSPRE
ncbi:MAG: ABC transporter substrate-binding protein [Chloroflexota bacterium]